jgi:hypothetical protein
MKEDRFDELMRDAAETYRRPPQPDLEAMWESIEREHFGASARDGDPGRRRGARFIAKPWIAIAATLVVGIGLGRASTKLGGASAAPAPAPVQVAAATPAPKTDSLTLAQPYETETSRYLDQTAALLIALPAATRSGQMEAQLTTRAGDLLGRTRLLLDSPAAKDPEMRNLLEDLELVLAQVVRLQNGHSRTELDLINRALEQRDVLPRLRSAVADIAAN